MSRNSRRAGALAAAFVIGFAVSTHTPALAVELTVGKAAPNADPIIPVNIGDKLGIFKKHGLDLKITDFTGGSKMSQAMAAGAIDIGDGAGTEMALVAKGVPMIAICESASTLPFLSIGVPYDSPIHSVDELKGKKIGVSSSGSLTDWLAKELGNKKGWGPEGVTRVAMGNNPTAIVAAFKDHLVDAYINVTSFFLSLEEKKTGRLLAPVSSYEGSAVSGALYASKHLTETNPDAIRAFLASWIETMDYIHNHKAETVKIQSSITGFSENVTAKNYDLTIGMFTRDCRFEPEGLATLKRSFVDLKLLKEAPDMSKLYTEAYLPKK